MFIEDLFITEKKHIRKKNPWMETIDGLNKLWYTTIMKFTQVNRNNVDKPWRC